MKHSLIYKEEKSDKFWNIDIAGNTFTVTYGKTGTAGQTQTKKFKDEAACLKEAQKLLNEKLKKGYLEKKGAKANQDKPSQKSKSAERAPSVKTAVSKQGKNEWWKYLVWILDERDSATESNIYYLSDDGVLSAPPSDEKLSQGTNARFAGLTSLVEVPLDKMPALDTLEIYPEEKKGPKLSSLDGIERAPGLIVLDVERNQSISDLGFLSKLPKLEVFNGSNNSIKDLAPLTACRNLKTLYLDKNKISDISPLSSLSELTILGLADNPIKDILPLAGLKKLKEIRVSLKLPKENLAKFEKLRPDVEISF
ncbi:WGR domain-containing protein [Leptospira weilii]|uniref:WGR domain-containing protein n=1 Tax=Leptospira weilii TaxID=28184 RepID=UPI0002C01D01|nr:WGR domain-containing protein [Leptospira weilii]EMN42486.1 leucine rich repeat protein [Leptospira weilii str. LNT 1234]ULH27771.1 WGR domain-containing protein [Leptospira weilii]